MNLIQKKTSAGRQWNQPLGAVVIIIKYKKSTMYNAIYIKVLSNVTLSYSKGSKYDILNTTNNKIEFPELRRGLE